ncbi:tail protein X [Mitsuaria sp. GD03876]|uniref:tail protein X n=1 Tax=Mitsuaria sp. GD03876 TaxID=2975399 RepID=UPI002448D069|nr:tail protein X [Mitsuaria sp. GD03876]MDH0866444.1 tail protein X [Mitsuaria sp. GD03876]
MRVRTLQGDTVDALCWRHLGRTEGVVAQTLLLNPGLADHGPVLPVGLAVDLPIPQPSTRPMVQLWT